ncbi:MAG: DUF2069 domain-containing protein [Zoogloeaceae bacterium]|jgi:uncharacterized membrane protein|nr:DUF2069 domain-containing protein [Zoogloeaceae bacterium]
MRTLLRLLRGTAAASLVALISLCLAWELWLAPVLPGGTWLAAKALPLVPVLPGILRGRRRACQLASLVALLYLLEGSLRATSDPGLSRWLALLETLLALLLFASVSFYARLCPDRENAVA